MLYERWRQMARNHPAETALRESPSGRRWTFAQLVAAAEKQPVETIKAKAKTVAKKEPKPAAKAPAKPKAKVKAAVKVGAEPKKPVKKAVKKPIKKSPRAGK